MKSAADQFLVIKGRAVMKFSYAVPLTFSMKRLNKRGGTKFTPTYIQPATSVMAVSEVSDLSRLFGS